MARALRYAKNGERGPAPLELYQLRAIDRFGALGVLGNRPLAVREINQMQVAELVVTAYNSRLAENNLTKWATENPYYNELLIKAELENARYNV